MNNAFLSGRLSLACSLWLANASLFAVPGAHAGGIYLWEIGTPTLGTAGAGWAATPEYASTAFTNPAGTLWREGTELMLSGQLLYGDVSFHDGGESNVAGNNGGNAIGWFPGGGAHAAGILGEDFGWGLSFSGNFGGVLDYRGSWKGRRFVQDVNLLGMNLIPSLSWRANSCLSFGLGLNIMGGYYDFKSAPRAGFLDTDASLKYKDTDVGAGANLGLIYKPTEATTLGLVYTSEVRLKFKDDLRLRDFGPLLQPLENRLDGARTEIKMNVPATATASLQQALTPATSLYANLNWQGWSSFGKVGLEVHDPNQLSASVNRKYRDTWHAALGLRHRLDSGALQGWSLSTGIAYDSSAVRDRDRTADFVTDAAWRFGLGAQKELCPGTTLDIGYTLVWMGDIPIDQQGRPPFSPRLQGEYKDSALHFFGASVQFSL